MTIVIYINVESSNHDKIQVHIEEQPIVPQNLPSLFAFHLTYNLRPTYAHSRLIHIHHS